MEKVDWASWGSALAGLSLVAEEAVVAVANDLVEALNAMESYLHRRDAGDGEWSRLQADVAAAQMRFVNAARRSLDRRQPVVRTRVGGPLIEGAPAAGQLDDRRPRLRGYAGWRCADETGRRLSVRHHRPMSLISGPESLTDGMVLRAARPGDEDTVLDLLAEAAAWLRGRGMEQ